MGVDRIVDALRMLTRAHPPPTHAMCVVCARWCPTLPHPGGCSTIGAVRLSFRVRNGSGRLPVAMTTETTVRAVRHRRLVRLFGYPCGRLSRPARTLPRGAWSGGWVGCGPYSGRFALSCCITHPLGHFTVQGRLVCGGDCCLYRLISTSQLSKPLPVFHS